MPPKKKKEAEPKKEVSEESKLQSTIDDLKSKNSNLEVQIAFLTEKLEKTSIDRTFYQQLSEQTETSLESSQEDSKDVLDHQLKQLREYERKIENLSDQIEIQKRELESKTKRIEKLEETDRKCRESLIIVDVLKEEKCQLENLVQSQSEMIERQSKEIESLMQRLEMCQKDGDSYRKTIEDLELKVQDDKKLQIVFDEAALISSQNRSTLGNAPSDRPFNAFSCISGEKLILFDGTSNTLDLHILDILSLQWETHRVKKLDSFKRKEMSVNQLIRKKLILFGGFKEDKLSSDVSILNTESFKWQDLDFGQGNQPQPRQNHGSCTSRDRLFIFGGKAEDCILDDLWALDTNAVEWKQLQSYGDEPSSREGATIALSEDARRLYLFGGFNGTKCLNDVYTFDIEKQVWTVIEVMGSIPLPRRRAIGIVIMNYLIIAGGVAESKDGKGVRTFGDVFVLDLSMAIWEIVDSGSWSSKLPWMQRETAYIYLYRNKCFSLIPERKGSLRHLRTTEYLLPDEVSKMKTTKKEHSLRTTLEIVNVIGGSNWLDVEWIPPTKNVDRIDQYKLMIATHTGTVTTAYEGKRLRFRISRLRQNTKYVLCVKAVYDDGSFLWSESRAHRTKCVSG